MLQADTLQALKTAHDLVSQSFYRVHDLHTRRQPEFRGS